MRPPIFAINIPNILTVLRILVTPFFVILLLKESYFMALMVFTLAGISDGVDGMIARYFNQRTILGAYLDPLADKMLLVAAYASLAMLNRIPDWLAVIVISRDVIIVLGIAIFTITHLEYEIRPSLLSKVTTFTQIATILITLMAQAYKPTAVFLPSLIWITAGITMCSGLHYLYVGLNILQAALGNTSSDPYSDK